MSDHVSQNAEMDGTWPGVKVRARLAVWGEFEPAELDELLGVVGETHRRTDLRRNGKPYPNDSWEYATSREESVDWPGHAERVLAVVRPRKKEFMAFCTRHGLEGLVGLTAAMRDGTPVGTLTRDAVQEIAELGFLVDIDLYLDTPE